jgi:beta-1,4-mannosyl-glycoprotein beta-1,4-N-acetylglucosaminyltransferase
MKFIDCFMYFDEDMILDVRLNILDKFVSYFVICEANYLHNGSKKEFKFDSSQF